MIKNKKTVLVLIVSLIIMYALVNLIFFASNGKKYKNTVFIGNETKVEVKNGKIKIYKENKSIKNQAVKIYFKKKIVDGFITLKYDKSSGESEFKLINNKNEELFPNSTFIVYTKDISIKIKDNDMYESNDLTDIYEFSKLNNIIIGDYFDLDYQEIINVDIDGDGKDEYIYSVGLIKSSGVIEEEGETSADEYDSFIFAKKDDKYFMIDREEGDYDGTSNIRLRFVKLIDFNNDDNYEFVIERMMSEYGPYNYELYNFNGKKFTKLGGE